GKEEPAGSDRPAHLTAHPINKKRHASSGWRAFCCLALSDIAQHLPTASKRFTSTCFAEMLASCPISAGLNLADVCVSNASPFRLVRTRARSLNNCRPRFDLREGSAFDFESRLCV